MVDGVVRSGRKKIGPAGSSNTMGMSEKKNPFGINSL
jgi:hypothetical protein